LVVRIMSWTGIYACDIRTRSPAPLPQHSAICLRASTRFSRLNNVYVSNRCSWGLCVCRNVCLTNGYAHIYVLKLMCSADPSAVTIYSSQFWKLIAFRLAGRNPRVEKFPVNPHPFQKIAFGKQKLLFWTVVSKESWQSLPSSSRQFKHNQLQVWFYRTAVALKTQYSFTHICEDDVHACTWRLC
jgi:hypothetical protein